MSHSVVLIGIPATSTTSNHSLTSPLPYHFPFVAASSGAHDLGNKRLCFVVVYFQDSLFMQVQGSPSPVSTKIVLLQVTYRIYPTNLQIQFTRNFSPQSFSIKLNSIGNPMKVDIKFQSFVKVTKETYHKAGKETTLQLTLGFLLKKLCWKLFRPIHTSPKSCSHIMPCRCRACQACLPFHIFLYTGQDKREHLSPSCQASYQATTKQEGTNLPTGFLQKANDLREGNIMLPRRARTTLFQSNISPMIV